MASYDIFAIIGQSNAYHGLRQANIDVGGSNVFKLSQAGVISTGDEPLAAYVDTVGIGPLVAFAREFYKPKVLTAGRDILVYCGAKGSTGFSTNDWNPGDTQYEAVLSRINTAIALDATNAFKALFVSMGETDARNSGYTQAQYRTKCLAMIADFRSRVTGATSVPVIWGGYSKEWIASESPSPYPDLQAFEDVLADLPNQGTNIGFAATDGLPGDAGDLIHISGGGNRQWAFRFWKEYARIALGKRYAAAF